MSKLNESISYDNRQFTSVTNSSNGEVSELTIFNYHQECNIIWAEYLGGDILKGFLVGKVCDDAHLEFSYQHINKSMEIRIGTCSSIPEILQDGRLRLIESWQWLNGDNSKGQSVIEEVL